MIEIIKTENPTLQVGDDANGYKQLSAEEYDAVINEWADARIAKEKLQAEAETKETERLAILNRIGLTADEAKLILG